MFCRGECQNIVFGRDRHISDQAKAWRGSIRLAVQSMFNRDWYLFSRDRHILWRGENVEPSWCTGSLLVTPCTTAATCHPLALLIPAWFHSGWNLRYSVTLRTCDSHKRVNWKFMVSFVSPAGEALCQNSLFALIRWPRVPVVPLVF